MQNLLNKSIFMVKKHSPAILTGAGILGLGATAYLAYRSRDKVEAVVEEVERRRDLGLEINKKDVAMGIAEAIYQPVIVGALSVTCIFASYRILNNRLATVAGALVVQQAQNKMFEAAYRKKHGNEAFEKFLTTDEVEEETVDKKGKPITKVSEVKKDVDKSLGQWFDESDEYVSDDHTYNMSYIDSVNDKLQLKLFQRGTLLLNEVREALGFERIRPGALLGWTTSDHFDINKIVTTLGDEANGELKEQIWVSWTQPRYIYDDIEFNGRYSPFN